jgi:hypothetical protein
MVDPFRTGHETQHDVTGGGSHGRWSMVSGCRSVWSHIYSPYGLCLILLLGLILLGIYWARPLTQSTHYGTHHPSLYTVASGLGLPPHHPGPPQLRTQIAPEPPERNTFPLIPWTGGN